MKLIQSRLHWLLALTAVVLSLALAGSALAAEFAAADTYRLAAGEVVADDLYVTGDTIIIDGTVEGDLVASGGYIEINGTVTDDLIAAAAGIVVNGAVGDDARIAGAGIDISGEIADDLIVGAGGGEGFAPTFPLNGRSVTPGLRIADGATIGGDTAVAAGGALIAGSIAGDLWAGAGQLRLTGNVGGDAQLDIGDLAVGETASVGGELRYETDAAANVPPGVASDVEFVPAAAEEQVNPIWGILGWIGRTLLILAGFALLSWLILSLAPRAINRPAAAIDTNPLQAVLIGLLIGLLLVFIPLLSALLVFLTVLFWGWFPGVVMGMFLFGTLALVWFFSPLVTGAWLGRRLGAAMGRDLNALTALLLGVLLIALLGQIPFFGWFVYLLSFWFALGGLFMLQRNRRTTQPATAQPDSVPHGMPS